uniref:Tyrosine--tRNA ligase, mitochondrial isoform X1 n=1 Tax=Geotrypetes seraphini TaxID=260995 RepID=A0A6P8PD08_GEOSA|nr:tyrosine--tRNA ligase, mitochondrial isoform X1 [Geotrypetes seraphini]XP_033773422.1 tyrosine--tRNA ligase, mitochondrial isoform X1 [Geotrypetes seraphini]XP_033773431.1 tyrosine--tRNA ligase, mitochondrial isoform X1 [Geotrypetes seraphini]XP_033773440.1 tyrosine--tRNA ligase, mitochondrial isoform X1 [Geotrypetes seraphini]XP_033773444.1 tyrosine--tRNA ligase, mitochondrial isoform X1 [Geotrypetes seraphini]XP_033773450.1 tyrosine--tRNA ligase, mitochondrial isoform X1 [Geotrypetes sera
MAVYACKELMYTVEEALNILRNPDLSKAIKIPPVNPRPGQVFLFSYAECADKKEDWRADQYLWIHQGVRRWPKKNPKLLKMYHQVKSENGAGNFFRYSYRLLKVDSTLVLIQYLGKVPDIQMQIHGNRKKNLGKFHIRSPPSVLLSMKKEQGKPIQIFQKLCSEGNKTSVMLPRDVQQVRNAKKAQKRKNQAILDDLNSAEEHSFLLDDFVWLYSLLPEVVVMAGHREMCKIFEDLASQTNDIPVLMSYDTTFKLGDYYISTLVFLHGFFKESPIVPLAFMLHKAKKELNHWLFFIMILRHCPKLCTERIVIASHEETAIQSIDQVFPTAKRVICWNHIRQHINVWVTEQGGSMDEIEFYMTSVADLLWSDSKECFEEKLREQQGKWSQPFVQYFQSNLLNSIVQYAGAWVLKEYLVSEPGNGIMTNISESFNVVLKRLVEWQEMPMETLVISLYYLQNYYIRELLRGQCHLGNYHLREEFMSYAKLLEDVTFPEMYCNPEVILDIARGQTELRFAKI